MLLCDLLKNPKTEHVLVLFSFRFHQLQIVRYLFKRLSSSVRFGCCASLTDLLGTGGARIEAFVSEWFDRRSGQRERKVKVLGPLRGIGYFPRCGKARASGLSESCVKHSPQRIPPLLLQLTDSAFLVNCLTFVGRGRDLITLKVTQPFFPVARVPEDKLITFP